MLKNVDFRKTTSLTQRNSNIYFAEIAQRQIMVCRFFAYDPARDGLRRKKYMLNHFKTRKEKECMGTILIHNIYQMLIAGWNPFTQGKRTRQYTELTVVLQRYKAFIEYQSNKGVMKSKTATDYLSRLKN